MKSNTAVGIIKPTGNNSGKFPSNTPNTTIALGGAPANTVLADRVATDVLTQMLVVYQNPDFSAFSTASQPATVEVGTTLIGTRIFNWTITNIVNLKPNSISIFDTTANSSLASSLSNDNTENIAITTKQLNANNATQGWKILAKNTKDENFESSLINITANYYRYFGPVDNRPTTSAGVKALSKEFQNANSNTFTLNTGNTNIKFIVALPTGRTIQSVVDLDALNAVITASYVLVGTINVEDAGATNRTYNLYEMSNAVPYSSNHRHQITTI